MIECISALDKIKQLPDNSQDIIFADPPYALGSTVFIDTDGKPKYKVASDFMNKWDMPNHSFWEEFFKEANRVLKYGGRCLLFGIDRQLMLFQYYAIMGGLETKQSLYWAFGSSFPKATDASKMIDKRLGAEREVIGTRNDFSLDGSIRNGDSHKNHKESAKDSSSHEYGYKANSTWDVDITKSTSELGQKYEGYKYSVSPMKQSVETIMVFQKPTKYKSTLDDLFAYEDGDKEISPSIWNIDGGRIPTEDSLDGGATSSDKAVVSKDGFDRPWMHDEEKLKKFKEKMIANVEKAQSLGRYPSQLLIDEEIAESINEQTGILTSGARKSEYTRRGKNPNETYGKFNEISMDDAEKDSGGGSRFYHNISLLDEDLDLLNYFSKVSPSERNYGLEGMPDLDIDVNNNSNPMGLNTSSDKQRNVSSVTKNNHPTLKPILLISKVATLLKTPNPQNVFFPFAGSGSEIIGFIHAGFDDGLFTASELSQDYINIANIRIEKWKGVDIQHYNSKKVIKRKSDKPINSKDKRLF